MKLEIKRTEITNDTDLHIHIGFKKDWRIALTVHSLESGDIGASHAEAEIMAEDIINALSE